MSLTPASIVLHKMREKRWLDLRHGAKVYNLANS